MALVKMRNFSKNKLYRRQNALKAFRNAFCFCFWFLLRTRSKLCLNKILKFLVRKSNFLTLYQQFLLKFSTQPAVEKSTINFKESL